MVTPGLSSRKSSSPKVSITSSHEASSTLAYTGSYPLLIAAVHPRMDIRNCVRSRCESQKGLAMIQIAARTKMNRDD